MLEFADVEHMAHTLVCQGYTKDGRPIPTELAKNISLISEEKKRVERKYKLKEMELIEKLIGFRPSIRNIYDLILIDQMMPGMDGTTTLSKLKEIKDFNCPVVVLTADAIKGRKEEYINAGFDDYISKPIDKKELSRVLKKYLMYIMKKK